MSSGLEKAPHPRFLTDQNHEERASVNNDVRSNGMEILDCSTYKLSLSMVLRLLFALNGITLGLETLGLLYVLNSGIEMPLEYLPTYGAIAFLPYSLKPLYGYLSQGTKTRFWLFAILLFTNGISVLSTIFIPKGGIFLACFVALFRGITDSWAELCLGLTLIDCASEDSSQNIGISFNSLASKYQAQAATSRNCGSLLSYGCTFVLFMGRQLHTKESRELNSWDANFLLASAASLQLLGVIVASLHYDIFAVHESADQGFTLIQHHDNTERADPDEEILADEGSLLRDDDGSDASYSSADVPVEMQRDVDSSSMSDTVRSRHNVFLVCAVQITILTIAMKGLIVDLSSHLIWMTAVVVCLMTTIFAGFSTYFNRIWETSHGVGLYLVLKHAVPSDSMVLDAYFYSLFQSSPASLQVLAFLGSGVTALSSWSYGRYLSTFNTRRRLLFILAVTTTLASIASLGNIAIFRHSQSENLIVILIIFKSIETFFGEWEFLPDVVLATTSLSHLNNEAQPEFPLSGGSSGRRLKNNNTGVEYGSLVACIDFGDQLGALAAGPLVTALGVSRENNFAHLDQLVLLCFAFKILSLGLLFLLGIHRVWKGYPS